MADMNDVKDRLKNMLVMDKEKTAVVVGKSDHVVCVFRLDSFDSVEAMEEALKKNFLILLDTTACGEECVHGIRGFMKGVAYPMQVWIQEVSESILVYLPGGYRIQEFQN